MASVGVAILTFNPGVEIIDTISRVLDAGVPPSAIVVVDNASPLGRLDDVRRNFPDVHVEPLNENVGYGAAMNRAADMLRASGAELFLFLTQEAQLELGSLERLKQHLHEDLSVGMVGPLLGRLSIPSQIWSAGGRLARVTGKPKHHGGGEATASVGSALTDVDWLDGACLLIRVAAFEAAGRFRDDLFLYWEDVALSRAVRRSGWRVCCARDALALQEPSMTPPYLMTRNGALVLGARGVIGGIVHICRWLVRDLATGKGVRRAVLGASGLRDALRDGRLDRHKALERP